MSNISPNLLNLILANVYIVIDSLLVSMCMCNFHRKISTSIPSDSRIEFGKVHRHFVIQHNFRGRACKSEELVPAFMVVKHARLSQKQKQWKFLI